MIVYGDFSCPYCYLASHRVDALRACGVEIDWRAVERRAQLPVIGLASGAGDRLEAELAEITGLLVAGEELPWALPAIVPKTEAAVSAYAEAYGAGVADDVRRLLFSMYWVEGADIGNPNVLRNPLAGPILRGSSIADPLRQAGYAVSVARGPITTTAWRQIRAWRREWQELGTPSLPTLLDGGATLTGALAARRLAKEMAHVDAPPTPELGDPRRYSTISVHPQAEWVSATGGRWAHDYMLADPTPT